MRMIDLVEKERVEGFLLSLTEKQEEYSLQLADNITKFNEVKLEYDNAKRYYRYLITSMQMEE